MRSTCCEGRLDTQADGNFISKSLVVFLGHKIRPYEGRGVLSGGGRITPSGMVSVCFHLQGLGKLKKSFFVLPNLPYDLFLGFNFIKEWKMYVNGNIFVLRLAPISPGMFSCHPTALNILASLSSFSKSKLHRCHKLDFNTATNSYRLIFFLFLVLSNQAQMFILDLIPILNLYFVICLGNICMSRAHSTDTLIAERETIRAQEAEKQREREAEMGREESANRAKRERARERARQHQHRQHQTSPRRN